MIHNQLIHIVIVLLFSLLLSRVVALPDHSLHSHLKHCSNVHHLLICVRNLSEYVQIYVLVVGFSIRI